MWEVVGFFVPKYTLTNEGVSSVGFPTGEMEGL